MINVKLIIEYDGTNYSGWQSQNNAIAIQDVVTDALRKLTGEDIKLIGASRTDAGVHACGQTANFFMSSAIPPEKICFAVNNLLPYDIVVKESSQVDDDFHARFSAKGKTYFYLIHNTKIPSVFHRNRACHIVKPLDFDAMNKASSYFIGTHNFESFRAAGCSVKVPIRTISSISLTQNENIIRMDITGDSFLYNMVRIIAGTLIYVGLGKIKPDEIPVIIESKDRKMAGKTVPACGLYLKFIYYGKSI